VKIPYAIGFVLWCMAAAGTAFAHSVAQLTTLRVLLGTFESLVGPASITWIRRNFLEENRGLAVGVYLTGTKIGPAIAAPLTVWLTLLYGWRPMFLLVGIGGALWLVPWMLLVKKDVPPTALEARKATAASVPFGRIMVSPITWGSVIISFTYMYFVYFCMTWMPAYFIEQRHLSISKMGAYTFFSFGGMALVAALAGWAADRMIARGGNAVTVRKWFVIVGFMIASTELIGARTSSVTVALVFAILSLSGLGLATANYWAVTQTLIPASAIGRVSGVVNCSASLSGIAAPIVTGWLKQRFGGFQAPMQTVWILLVFRVMSYLVLMREKYAPQANTKM
jgi:MFS family permease